MPQYKYRDEDQHLIENYELAKEDDFKGWVLHHRLEFDLEGNEVHTPASLKKLGMYYRRPYFELIYMTRHEHQILHNKAKKGKEKMMFIQQLSPLLRMIDSGDSIVSSLKLQVSTLKRTS